MVRPFLSSSSLRRHSVAAARRQLALRILAGPGVSTCPLDPLPMRILAARSFRRSSFYACPLRRIAATFKAKINRRRLDKLDIIKICEEILNPSVPTALRPSRILMDDVSRLLVNLELKVCSAFY
ncbi:hypothetical protein ZWY2020_028537 [Hordeum vulgare]|nr:hypothetical protein ZWY2020_028537 [Hordeum vulgare]